jgi:hypothetical protein
MTDEPEEENTWHVASPFDEEAISLSWAAFDRLFVRDGDGRLWLSEDQGATFREVPEETMLNDMEKAELERKIRGLNGWLSILFLVFVGVVGCLSWLLVQDTISVIKFIVLAAVWTIIIWALMFGVQGVRKGYEKELEDGTSGE